MVLARLAAGLVLVAVSAVMAAGGHADIQMARASLASREEAQHRPRRFLQADPDGDVCYEGCLAAPIGGLASAAPILPILLGATGDPARPMPLLECYAAAVRANAALFAIVDETRCYGGNMTQPGWAPDSCPLECAPNGDAPYVCGGVDKASLFSMGLCQYLDAPCAPEDASPPPPSPPSPPPSPPLPPRASNPKAPGFPPPPRPPATPMGEDLAPPEEPVDAPPHPPPPPPASGKQYRCKIGLALWGTPMDGAPVKLNPVNSTPVNTEECQRLCDGQSACAGYFYKTTGWCYMLSEVFSFSKPYGSAVQACKVVTPSTG